MSQPYGFHHKASHRTIPFVSNAIHCDPFTIDDIKSDARVFNFSNGICVSHFLVKLYRFMASKSFWSIYLQREAIVKCLECVWHVANQFVFHLFSVHLSLTLLLRSLLVSCKRIYHCNCEMSSITWRFTHFVEWWFSLTFHNFTGKKNKIKKK